MADWRGPSFRVFQPGRLLAGFLILIGLSLILFGVLIFIVPRLLEFLVAAVFIMLGVMLLGMGWRWWRASRIPVTRQDADVLDPWERPL